ncbi:DNA polymerase III subunit delta [Candidatus Endowatersipora endosymbiont of Watersipora subatra]|uniref:DNA polymerase III subunit delta n=1 Tax=Candidatus Endowatersipora endosymbiont of Watersipora subatra TaxID=3077946 RepID=UPI00312C9BA8
MVTKKADEVDMFLKKPETRFTIVLIYGPDRGLVFERGQVFAQKTGIDLNDPFSTVRIDADNPEVDFARINDEIHTRSMFGHKRLIWIRGQIPKNITRILKPVFDLPPFDSIILVEGGVLRKSNPLRSRIEKSTFAIALPCYQDQACAIDQIINDELTHWNLKMSREARLLLKKRLGGDRMASRSEINKLCLYALGKGKIELDDIRAIVSDVSELAIDELLDSVFTGHFYEIETIFSRLMIRGIPPYQITLALQKNFQMILESAVMIESRNENPQSVISRLHPSLNLQRRNNIIKAVSIWNRSALERILIQLQTASLEVRKNTRLAQSLTSITLLAIAREAY